ncbi:EamA family transporter [Actinomadura gamaensis]|uniref:EamA family transporter n=1 Tax=Actinomadura gamaensis TaxID=1763541 RepID=A0ABV9UC57_9ACTN
MGEALALAAAVGFGTTHFLSGLLSRRVDATAVALVAQLGGTLIALLAAPWFAAPHVTPGDLAWGALSGVGTGVGVAFLYRALGEGDFSVVVPLSDVAAVALPVLVGVLVLSERPGAFAWVGMAAAIPALYLVARPAASSQASADAGKQGGGSRGGGSRGRGSRSSALRGGGSRDWASFVRVGGSAGTRDALVAGVAFAVQFVALARTGSDAGLWPLVASRVASVVAILPMASAMWREADEPARQRVLASQTVWHVREPEDGRSAAEERARAKRGLARVRMSAGTVAGALGTGMLGTVAMTLYLLATHEQLMTLAVVLTALYPVIPVVLGLGVLRERVGRAQVAGLGFAAAAIALISLG